MTDHPSTHPPIVTRDVLAAVLNTHDWREGDEEYGRPCRHADHQFHAFCGVCSGDVAAIADVLFASGILRAQALDADA